MANCKVVGNEPITLPSIIGGYTTGRRITFTTPRGTVGVVKVTDAQVTDGSWEDAVSVECAKLEAIDSMGQ